MNLEKGFILCRFFYGAPAIKSPRIIVLEPEKRERPTHISKEAS